MTTITVSAPPDQFARTREAIARFDRYHARWNREFWRVLNEPETRENFDYDAFVLKSFENCERYRKPSWASVLRRHAGLQLQGHDHGCCAHVRRTAA